MRYSDYAWMAIAGAVLTAEALAPKGELLSEAVDRYLTTHPVTTRIVIVYIAAHLMNLVPNSVDPLHILARTFGR